MMVTKKPADFRHTRVFSTGIEGRAILLRVQLHAAELIDIKGTTESADTLLLENSRTTIFTFHSYITD